VVAAAVVKSIDTTVICALESCVIGFPEIICKSTVHVQGSGTK
jgi:hypothetical protein